jgi:mannose-1-phosphate guanylyltransferase
MACLTADHYIGNPHQFVEILAAAEELAREGALVTLGISPAYPATGYGYIHIGPPLRQVRGFQASRVLSFTEKPTPLVAADYLRSGDYAWNSGMFVWRADRILEEMRRSCPSCTPPWCRYRLCWGLLSKLRCWTKSGTACRPRRLITASWRRPAVW